MEYAVSRIALVAVLLLMLGVPAMAQPCNPVIDGTYCAEEASRRANRATSPTGLPPIRNIADDFSPGQDPEQPATLGAITFRGNGTRCIGLLRRGACN
jgi:hypothetical protein